MDTAKASAYAFVFGSSMTSSKSQSSIDAFDLFLRLQRMSPPIPPSPMEGEMLPNLIYMRRRQAYLQRALLMLHYVAPSPEKTHVAGLLDALLEQYMEDIIQGGETTVKSVGSDEALLLCLISTAAKSTRPGREDGINRLQVTCGRGVASSGRDETAGKGYQTRLRGFTEPRNSLSDETLSKERRCARSPGVQRSRRVRGRRYDLGNNLTNSAKNSRACNSASALLSQRGCTRDTWRPSCMR